MVKGHCYPMALTAKSVAPSPRGGTMLTAYLKLAALYNLCAAPSLRTTHYSLLTFFWLPATGYWPLNSIKKEEAFASPLFDFLFY